MSLLSHPAVVALYALFLWWLSTGVVLYVVGRPRCNSRLGLLGAAALFAASLYGMARNGVNTSVAGAYFAFTCAVLSWGAQEFAFLAGFITGPRTEACPKDCTGWRRTVLALEAVIYHEIALILSAIAAIAATWNAGNRLGAWTFLLLWAMRVSAKLNLFAGVPVLNHEFLPKRMEYLASFFAQRPVCLFFPVTVTAATAVTTILAAQAMAADANAFHSTGNMLLASLMALGVLEHWFMVLPAPIAALWSWGMPTRTKGVHGASIPSISKNAARGVTSKRPSHE